MATERELVGNLAEKAVEMFEDDHGQDLPDQANAVARKYGIDGGYLQHVLHHDMSSWPRLPGRQQEALNAFVGLSDAAFAFNDNRFQLPPVDDEYKTDLAIAEMGKWAWEQRTELQRSYFRMLREFRRQAAEHLMEATGKTWSDRDAQIWLHAALKEEIENNPVGIWRGTMLYRLLDLVL